MRLVVLASGRGSNLRALMEAIDDGQCHAHVAAVISDRKAAPAVELAAGRGIATETVMPSDYPDRETWDAALAEAVAKYAPGLVVLAGFMRIVGAAMLSRFPSRIINVHPALLPAFPGTDAPAQAVAKGVTLSGCTVHVVDSGVDTGPILAQAAVPVLGSDDAASLHARIQAVEHSLLPAVVDAIARGWLVLEPAPPRYPEDTSQAQRSFAWPPLICDTAMAKNFYDAVLIGLGLPTLVAGGLLAKRGFRVLVSQGQPLPSYVIEGITVPRAPFTLTGADSPAITRVFSELALKPLLRRRTLPLAPAFQALLPRHRIDFTADAERFAREVEREFPAVRRTADEFMRATARAWESIDRLVARDVMWPPSTFFERRAFTRATSHHPFGRDDHGPSPLGDLPDEHPLRQIVDAVLASADGSRLGDDNPQRLLRIFGSALRGVALDEGGYAGLVELLMHSIRTHNGDVRFADRVERIGVRRGAIEGVRLSPSDDDIGCHFVLNGLPVSKLGRLLSDRSCLDAMLDELGSPAPRFLRYTLNVVANADAIPEGLGRNTLVLPDAHGIPGPAQALQLQVERRDNGLAVFTTETLLPVLTQDAQLEQLRGQRERVFQGLERVSPFLLRHVTLLDSPHDGRGVWSARDQRETPTADAWSRGPETMVSVYAFARTRLHGTCALPVRTAVRRLLLCNEQVLPGLGLEGSFITAWSAARAVTRALNRDWMNRGRWTKVDL